MQFRIDVTDLGVPPRKSNSPATITVRVIRNKHAPTFRNLPATVSLNQTQPKDTQVWPDRFQLTILYVMHYNFYKII
jgi:hypothetical protein